MPVLQLDDLGPPSLWQKNLRYEDTVVQLQAQPTDQNFKNILNI